MKELLSFLNDRKNKHLILFGGKGGVGKTSIAAATSIKCSELGLKTLITSSDPAHSLSDVFDQESIMGGEIVEIDGYNNLYALETDPKKVLDEYNHYLEDFPELKLLLGEEFEEFPGANEGFGLLNIIRRLNNEDWDIIVVDTAPTGHTLKLLSFPDFLSKTTIKLIRIRAALGSFVDKIAGFFRRRKKGEQKDISEFLEIAKQWSEETKKVLSDKNISMFLVVMIPELLSINETQRLISSLNKYQIPIGGIFINKFFPNDSDCKFCLKKRELQDKNYDLIKKLFDNYPNYPIPFFDNEIHGILMLNKLKRILYSNSKE
ncbi:MAG: ArsA family ATPase [Candidatus Helarchaeota archaeon]